MSDNKFLATEKALWSIPWLCIGAAAGGSATPSAQSL